MNNIVKKIIKRAGLALASAAIIATSLSSLVSPVQALSVASGNDCDDNAVIYCGADSTQSLISSYVNGISGHNTAKSIQDIYTHFGISSAEVHSLNSSAVAGRVTKTGVVYLDNSNTSVAIGAVTAGRSNLPGSTAVTENGTSFFTRRPLDSFRSDSLPAYIVMKDGVFQYAILAACGNPVKATAVNKPAPPPTPIPTPTTPNYTVTKEVAPKGSTQFSKNITANAGATVHYRISVKSTGTADVTHLFVSDVLPSGITYVSDSFAYNGAAVSDSTAKNIFANGVGVSSLAPGALLTMEFDATIGSTDPAATCTAQTLNNVAHVAATSLPTGTSSASVNEQCVTAPQCTNLVLAKGDNHTVTVTALNYVLNDATFQNAVINWGDNTATTPINDASKVTGQTHKYANDGTYTVTANLTFVQNGHPVQVTSAACQQPISYNTTVTPAAAVTTLVNTGPGSIAGMFFGIATLAAFAHRYLSLRRIV